MNDGVELETLLVLCCLLGAVTFLSFSVGAVNLGISAPASATGAALNPAERDESLRGLAAAEAQVAKLERDVTDRTVELSRRSANDDARDAERRSRRIEELQRDLAETDRRIGQVKKTLADARMNKGADTPRPDDVEELRQRQRALTWQLEHLQKEVSNPDATAPDAAELQGLRARRARLDQEIGELQSRLEKSTEQPGTFSVRQRLRGSTTMTNPVIVECRRDQLVFHPEGRIVAASELGSANPFGSLLGRADGIVFLIRPDGFDPFEKSFKLVEKTGLPIIYEAVDAHLKLQF